MLQARLAASREDGKQQQSKGGESVLMSHRHSPALLFLFSNKLNVKSYFIHKTNDLFQAQPPVAG